jgi:hypothetical protein
MNIQTVSEKNISQALRSEKDDSLFRVQKWGEVQLELVEQSR